VLHEVLLTLSEAIPILVVLGQVDLLGSPKGSLVFLVHLEDCWVLNGQQDPTPRVLLEKWVGLLQLSVLS